MSPKDSKGDKENSDALNESFSLIQKACENNLDLYKLLVSFQNKKKKFHFTLKRGAEKTGDNKIEEIKKKYNIPTVE